MFYKYISINNSDGIDRYSRFNDMISKRSLYFSNWETFNDIGEGKFDCDECILEFVRIFSVTMDQNLNRTDYNFNLKKLIIEHKKQYSVLCATTNKTHALMWALYADQHRGLCVGFNPTKMIKRLNVHYSKVVPHIKPKIDDGYDDNYFDELVERFLGTKSYDFSSESEVRFIVKADPGLKDVFLDEVILGCNFPTDKKREVYEHCSRYDIVVYESRSLPNSYELSIERYKPM